MGLGLPSSRERTEPPDSGRPPGMELVSVGTLRGPPRSAFRRSGCRIRPGAGSQRAGGEAGVRHRGDLRKCLFAGEGELACLIACRPYPPSGDLDLTPIHQGHAPDKVHLVEDQAGGSSRRDQDHFDIDPVTGAGERRERDITWFGLRPRSQVGGRHDDAVAPTPALAGA